MLGEEILEPAPLGFTEGDVAIAPEDQRRQLAQASQPALHLLQEPAARQEGLEGAADHPGGMGPGRCPECCGDDVGLLSLGIWD